MSFYEKNENINVLYDGIWRTATFISTNGLCNVVQIEIKRSKVQVELEHGNFFSLKRPNKPIGRVLTLKMLKLRF